MDRHRWAGTRRLGRRVAAGAWLLGLVTGCGQTTGSGTPTERNDLTRMDKTTISIKDQAFEVWLAIDDSTRRKGLMQVTREELAPLPDGIERGMLFVFRSEQILSFWMHNTITPLDIAYIRQDGQIVKTSTMAPLETRTYPSVEPATYALEVSAGLFDRLNIGPGDHVEISDSVLKGVR